MNRPLIVCDCDEVLLHMVAPFRDWLAETQGVAFEMRSNDFSESMRDAKSGEVLDKPEIWRLLGMFFDTQMHRQTSIEGAVEAMRNLAHHADVVVLTNLSDSLRNARQMQLASHDIAVPVFTNQGPKGPALQRIIAEYRPSHAIFIDDLPQHHRSARETIGDVTLLHLCGEPLLAPHIDCAHKAGHADARIDNWIEALPWLLARIDQITQKEKEPA